jgi:hypothetical protein
MTAARRLLGSISGPMAQAAVAALDEADAFGCLFDFELADGTLFVAFPNDTPPEIEQRIKAAIDASIDAVRFLICARIYGEESALAHFPTEGGVQ